MQDEPPVLRMNAEFSCDMPYDEVVDGLDPQPGRTVTQALGEMLKELGCKVDDEVIDGGDHGWYLDFSYRSVRPRLELTAIDGIVIHFHGPGPTRPWFGKPKPANPDYVEILMRLGEAIQADPRFHDLGWFNHEEVIGRQVGAPTPVGPYNSAHCERYFGP